MKSKLKIQRFDRLICNLAKTRFSVVEQSVLSSKIRPSAIDKNDYFNHQDSTFL